VNAGEPADFTSLRAAHRSQKRDLIVRAAGEVFAERGVEGSSVAHVARAAGLSPASLYTYFASREEILFAASFAEIDDLEKRMRDTISDSAPADVALWRMVEAYVHFARERPNGFRMLIAGSQPAARAKVPPELVGEWDRRAGVCLGLLTAILRRGMDEGVFRPGDAEELTIAIWGAFHGILQLVVPFDVEPLVQRTLDALLQGIKR
jgi:AcrR family transcriptional regulator